MVNVDHEAQRIDDMPHNDRLERAVLGCVLLQNSTLYEAQKFIKTPLAFYRATTRAIWSTMCEIADRGMAIDELSLLETLADKDMGGRSALDVIGGQRFVVSMTREVASVLNADLYAQQLLELYRRRVLVAESRAAALRILAGGSSEEGMRHLNNGIAKATDASGKNESTADITKEWFDWNEARLNGQGGALRCGVDVIDALLHWEPGELHIVGAYTGAGKTALLSAIIAGMMRTYSKPPRVDDKGNPLEPDMRVVVSVHQTEVARVKLASRIITAAAGGSLKEQHLIRPEMMPAHMQTDVTRRAVAGMKWLSERDCFLRDSRTLTIDEIKTETRRLRATYPTRPLVVVVDYLQMVEVVGVDNEYEEIRQAVKALVDLAADTKCIMIVASQLTERSGEGMPLAMPQASQVKGNRKTKDATARFLKWHRPWAWGDWPSFGVLELEKDRYGVPGHVLVDADMSTKQFRPWEGAIPDCPGLYTQRVDVR